MDFELNKEQKMIQKNVREFMVKEIGPIADQIDLDDKFPKDLWKKMGDLGLLGLTLPEAYGGSEYDIFTSALVMEQMGRISPAVALSYGTHVNLCAHNLEKNATEGQKLRYLPGLCSGDLIGCLGLTEPDAGSDAVGIKTTAVKNGNGFILNGSKMFITNAPIADIALVYAKTDPEKGAKGITAFIVEKEFSGFSVSGKLEKIGHRGSPTGELVFNDCFVPEENVLGKINEGIKVMMRGLDVERAVVAAMALGIGEAALELALQYSKQRHQFGEPICNFQLIKAKLADMYTELEAARFMVYRAAVMAGKAKDGGKGTEVHKVAAAAILFTAETVSRAVNQSLQIHGGYGYTLDYPINRFYRDAKLYEIGAGTSEIRRIVIGNELIKRGLRYS
ncbi:MAG: acyl-CoA dehydrogenase family protein [Thermodesulfobacteriota bacterium]|nr:acyl-CoA dehydrogenase family protein [Thermodesulfobacteriota bacterium]